MTSDDDDDITARYHGGNEFSRRANARTRKARDIARIKEWILQRGRVGATCYECRIELGLSHQTCSARFTELKTPQHGRFLVKRLDHNGEHIHRPTDTGSQAGVWLASCYV